MNKLKFQEARDRVLREGRVQNGIGTLGEKSMHAILKHYFEEYEFSHEVRIGPFVADIVGESGIIEIQTRSFERLRKKLEAFLEAARVTVVYPVALSNRLIWTDSETGEILRVRKSPRQGRIYEIFPELYKIKNLLNHPNLRICIVMLETEEYRVERGQRKRGKTLSQGGRVPIDIHEEIYIENPGDYSKFIPEEVPEVFTAPDYKKAAGVGIQDARIALNVLNHMGAVVRVGKKGNMYVYERA